ncbi:MAG: AbrB/MazE/SpoVT family DNA-binding domain-containing protein [Opitutales bacterium]|nr:AbrB/MazE/SpoVT family DNA-binding domain-containing protein [Opitutales bacterium]
MDTAYVTSKHQITIPAKVRRSLNLHKGDRLAFEAGSEGGAFLVRKIGDKKSDGAAVPYLLGNGSKALSADAMAAAVGEGAVASWKRRQA